jgi:hypothetical protein
MLKSAIRPFRPLAHLYSGAFPEATKTTRPSQAAIALVGIPDTLQAALRWTYPIEEAACTRWSALIVRLCGMAASARYLDVRVEPSRERGNGGNGHTEEKWMQSSWPGSSGAHSHDREHSWQVISPTVPSCTSMEPPQFGQGKEMIVAPNANKLAMVDCLQRLMNRGNAELICMIRANIETGTGSDAAW